MKLHATVYESGEGSFSFTARLRDDAGGLIDATDGFTRKSTRHMTKRGATSRVNRLRRAVRSGNASQFFNM